MRRCFICGDRVQMNLFKHTDNKFYCSNHYSNLIFYKCFKCNGLLKIFDNINYCPNCDTDTISLNRLLNMKEVKENE
jgi:hypothetical protein